MLHACDMAGNIRCMTATRWSRWVDQLIAPDSPARAAERAGFDRSAFTRWSKGASADPAFAVKLARAYGASPIEALTAAGLITDAEAQMRSFGMSEALSLASDAALIEQISRRLEARHHHGPAGVTLNSWAKVDPDDRRLIAAREITDAPNLTVDTD